MNGRQRWPALLDEELDLHFRQVGRENDPTPHPRVEEAAIAVVTLDGGDILLEPANAFGFLPLLQARHRFPKMAPRVPVTLPLRGLSRLNGKLP